MKKRGAIIVVILVCVCSMAAGIFVPRYLLAHDTGKQENQIQEAPEAYYVDAGVAMARNASQQLSSLDRFKLITGQWESEYELSTSEDAFLSETEAVELAKQQLELYYEKGLYPYSLTSQYENWYSFSIEVYQCVDSSFHTYSAYLWRIVFTKYDHTLTHEIYMSDSGFIVLARVNERAGLHWDLKGVFEHMDLQELFVLSGEVYDLTLDGDNEMYVEDISLPGYEAGDVDNIKGCHISGTCQDGDIEVRALQFCGENQYGIAIMPE